jgi:hypothetical protein
VKTGTCVKIPLIAAFRTTLAGRRNATGNRPTVASGHATKGEFARLFAAAYAQLSTLRNRAR